MAQIHFDDFLKVEIRTGKILRAEAFPKRANRRISCGSTSGRSWE